MTRLYRRLQQPYGRFSVFFIITEHWQGVQTLPLDDVFFDSRDKCRVRPYTNEYTNHQLLTLLHSSWLFSWFFHKEVPWLDLIVHCSLTTMAQGPLFYAFSHTCEDCHSPLRWPTYVVRKNESFSRNLGGKAGQKVWSVNIDESKGPTTGRTVPGLLGA